MSKEKLTNQLKKVYKSLEEEFKNKGRPNTIEDNNVDYDNCNLYAMRQKISDLEAKLAESEEAIKCLKGIKRYDIGELLTENTKLKQQLADKEKLLTRLNKNWKISRAKQRSLYYKLLEKQHQDKISFAVEKLEKVKEFVIRQLFITTKDCSDLDEAEAKGCNELREETIKEIDNQIKQLKEGNKCE